MCAISLLALGVLVYIVAAVVFWPSSGEPPGWALPLLPVFMLGVKLWDERGAVALVLSVYSVAAMLLFLGYRFIVFLLG